MHPDLLLFHKLGHRLFAGGELGFLFVHHFKMYDWWPRHAERTRGGHNEDLGILIRNVLLHHHQYTSRSRSQLATGEIGGGQTGEAGQVK